jgi:hypothetical protein
VKPVANRRDHGAAVCDNCARRLHAEPCSSCGEVGNVSIRTEAGPICDRCYRASHRPREACSVCGEVRVVEARDARGRPTCATCQAKRRPKEVCILCGRKSPVNERTPDGSVGACCYSNYRAERCGICGKVRPVVTRTPDGRAACTPCYLRQVKPKERCTFCHQVRAIPSRTADGRPVCFACYTRELQPKHPCVFCGETKPGRRTERGYACNACFAREVNVGPCVECGITWTIQRRLEGGGVLCRVCDGKRKKGSGRSAPRERS